MDIIKKLAKSGMFGVAGLAATNKDAVNKIARNGGLGLVGMALAKKKAAQGAGGMGVRDAGMGAPIMGGDVDAMMGRGAQRDMSGMKKGGKVKKMAKGGSTASKRGDGCATKGKTKGRFV
jgi:hypothetical protein